MVDSFGYLAGMRSKTRNELAKLGETGRAGAKASGDGLGERRMNAG